jgi:hypothetical protein
MAYIRKLARGVCLRAQFLVETRVQLKAKSGLGFQGAFAGAGCEFQQVAFLNL